MLNGFLAIDRLTNSDHRVGPPHPARGATVGSTQCPSPPSRLGPPERPGLLVEAHNVDPLKGNQTSLKAPRTGGEPSGQQGRASATVGPGGGRGRRARAAAGVTVALASSTERGHWHPGRDRDHPRLVIPGRAGAEPRSTVAAVSARHRRHAAASDSDRGPSAGSAES